MAPLSTLCLTLALQLISANPLHLDPRQAPCPTGVHMVVAGGNGTIDNTGLLQPLVDNTASRYPGSDSWLTPYDGSQNPTGFATQQMTTHVREYNARCPGTPIALLGYSLGGVVVANTVCGGVPFPSNIIAAVAYGDETRVAGQSFNRGTCTTSSVSLIRP